MRDALLDICAALGLAAEEASSGQLSGTAVTAAGETKAALHLETSNGTQT